jgi:uncharacterized protein
VLAYLFSWAIWLPLYGHIFGITGLPTFPFNHAAGGLGPLLAALFTARIFEGSKSVKKLLRYCVQVKPLSLLLLAMFSPFLLALLAVLLHHLVNGASIDLSAALRTKEFPGFNLLSFFVYNLFFFGFGEEAGWRGFALPRLQGRFNPVTASLVLTVFWTLWHLPLFFYRPGYTSMEVDGIAGWVFSLITGSILLSWFYNSSRGSILICAVFHSTIDIVFTADLANTAIVNYMGFMITLWGIATLFILKPKA